MAELNGNITVNLNLTGTLTTEGTLVGTISAGQVAPSVNLQEKTVTTIPLGTNTILPDADYDGMSQVTVPAAFAETHDAVGGTIDLSAPTGFSVNDYNTINFKSGGTTLKTYTAGGGSGGIVTYGATYTQLPDKAFEGASGITECDFYGNVQIGNEAFKNCSSIRVLKFFNTILGSNIGDDAFAYSGLTDIYAYSRVMLAHSMYALYDYDTSQLTLHVPADMLSTYQASGSGWSTDGCTIVGDLPNVKDD